MGRSYVHDSLYDAVNIDSLYNTSLKPSDVYVCISKLTIIGSDNGLLPGRHQAIIWTSAGILSIGPLWTNFSEMSIKIQTFSLKKLCLKMSSVMCCQFCLSLNVLNQIRLFELTKDTLYLILTGKLCGVSYEHFMENNCKISGVHLSTLTPGRAEKLFTHLKRKLFT